MENCVVPQNVPAKRSVRRLHQYGSCAVTLGFALTSPNATAQSKQALVSMTRISVLAESHGPFQGERAVTFSRKDPRSRVNMSNSREAQYAGRVREATGSAGNGSFARKLEESRVCFVRCAGPKRAHFQLVTV